MKGIYKSIKTLNEMMTDRKYIATDVPPYEEWLKGYEEVAIDKVRESLTVVYSTTLPPTASTTESGAGNRILAMWISAVSLGSQNVQHAKEEMDARKVTRCIMIIQGKITPYAKNAIKNLRILSYNIETFTEEELQFNITKHELVPRHIICSAAKKEAILKSYAVTKTQLPCIRSTDPQVRYLGATKNQLIKIVRKSDTMHSIAVNPSSDPQLLYDISYRIVV